MLDGYESPMHRVEKIHFIGIGGAGMSGIAEVLCNLGYTVTGSDTSVSNRTAHMENIGIGFSNEHAARNIEGADVVVYSSAISNDNVELQAARGKRIPIVPRAEMLAELMRFRRGIAVTGTHGKTTTTSLIASILAEAGLDPTFVVGGLVRSVNSHARLGTGDFLVAEADESDASFLLLNPLMAVLTNVDEDHMATYGGDFSALKATFLEFFRRLPFYGVACICIDDRQAASLAPEIRTRVITYGTHEDADVRGSKVRHVDGREHFRVSFLNQEVTEDFILNLPGEHNVLNALAAITVTREIGVSLDAIRAALTKFQGIARRCTIHRAVKLGDHTVTLIDDYGHHPKEISVVLQTIKRSWPTRRIVLVFQPHRYSRTRDLFEDFVAVLSQVDILLLLEIYPAGETAIPGIDGQSLCHAIKARGLVEPIFVNELLLVQQVLEGVVRDDDILAILGAGSIGGLGESIAA